MLLVELLEGSWGSIYSLKSQLELALTPPRAVPGWCSTSQARPSNACSSSSATHRRPMPRGRVHISERYSIRMRDGKLRTLDIPSP